MAGYGEAITVIFTVWDCAANTPKLGDVANLTMRVIKDGVAAGAANAPVEVENGEYKLALTIAERTCDFLVVEGSSASPNTVVIPTKLEVPASLDQIAGAIMEKLVADHKAVAGSLAAFINLIAAERAEKMVTDEDANTEKIYDTDGITLLRTLTHVRVDEVITRTPS